MYLQPEADQHRANHPYCIYKRKGRGWSVTLALGFAGSHSLNQESPTNAGSCLGLPRNPRPAMNARTRGRGLRVSHSAMRAVHQSLRRLHAQAISVNIAALRHTALHQILIRLQKAKQTSFHCNYSSSHSPHNSSEQLRPASRPASSLCTLWRLMSIRKPSQQEGEWRGGGDEGARLGPSCVVL